MNLTKLFEMQAELDKRIVEEKGLEGADLLPKKILALQVELGELANEWRGFKFWSNDQEPRNHCIACEIPEVEAHDCYNPLLEEYVDCLHFFLSIGNDLEIDVSKLDLTETCSDLPITRVFSELMVMLPDCLLGERRLNKEKRQEIYDMCISNFIELGKMLGFTWNQIEQAYIDKNEINHARQESGY